MAYECEGPGYTVHVQGRVIGLRDWGVRAVIAYRGDLGGDERSRAVAEARSAAVIGILRESRRGRRFGAERVRVRIEGDPILAGGFTMTRPRALPARVA